MRERMRALAWHTAVCEQSSGLRMEAGSPQQRALHRPGGGGGQGSFEGGMPFFPFDQFWAGK